MCCRYWAEESPELRAIVEEMNRSPLVRKWQQTTGIKTYGESRPDVKPEELAGAALTEMILEKAV